MHGIPLNYDTTPLDALGIPVIIHDKPGQHKPWDYRGRDDFSTFAALNHYCCQQAIDAKKKELSITDTVEFCHQYVTQPSLTPTDCLIHALHTLTAAMHHTSEVNSKQQLLVIKQLSRLFHTWSDTKTTTYTNPKEMPKLTPSDVTRLPQESPV